MLDPSQRKFINKEHFPYHKDFLVSKKFPRDFTQRSNWWQSHVNLEKLCFNFFYIKSIKRTNRLMLVNFFLAGRWPQFICIILYFYSLVQVPWLELFIFCVFGSCSISELLMLVALLGLFSRVRMIDYVGLIYVDY